MKVMILAAGEGQRMQPLTNERPKALLPVNGKPLIEHLIHALARDGFEDFVINLFYRGEMIERALGEGERFGVNIHYSRESELLETGGGILNALPALGQAPFVVVNADLYTDFEFAALRAWPRADTLGHLVMVDNPAHRASGDFAIDGSGLLSVDGSRLTYAGIGVLSPSLFEDVDSGSFPLRDLLIPAARAGRLTGEHYRGFWIDVGTPERYRRARERQVED